MKIERKRKDSDSDDLIEQENYQVASKVKSKPFFSIKLVFYSFLFITAIVLVSLNINPMVQYVLNNQNYANYPILKKYANDLKGISSRLTVVTRRLNMLSLISEENEHDNISRINSLVLQINEMWFTTRKYLNIIGIETVAHTELEREIIANSKVNEKGIIRETNTEESFPEDQLTVTSILKLDSIVQDLNVEIDNINNEITFLEDNVYADIKASHIYSHLLERSRIANGNFYDSSPVASVKPTNNIQIDNQQLIKPPTKTISIVNNITVEPNKTSTIELPQESNKKTSLSKTIEPITVTKSTNTVNSEQTIKIQEKPQEKVEVANIKVQRKKIVGAFTVKEKLDNSSRKDNSNKLVQQNKKDSNSIETAKIDALDNNPTNPDNSVEGQIPFENPFLSDDTITGFVTNFDDYGDPEEEENSDSGNLSPVEDDDYTGG